MFTEIGTHQFNLSEYGKLQVVGYTDSVPQCACCGKDGLKRTAVMKDSDGNYSFFGTTCAYNASKYWATSENQKHRVSIPVKITLKNRTFRIDEDGNCERLDNGKWVEAQRRGLSFLILDSSDELPNQHNADKVIGILEGFGFKFPF